MNAEKEKKGPGQRPLNIAEKIQILGLAVDYAQDAVVQNPIDIYRQMVGVLSEGDPIGN